MEGPRLMGRNKMKEPENCAEKRRMSSSKIPAVMNLGRLFLILPPVHPSVLGTRPFHPPASLFHKRKRTACRLLRVYILAVTFKSTIFFKSIHHSPFAVMQPAGVMTPGYVPGAIKNYKRQTNKKVKTPK